MTYVMALVFAGVGLAVGTFGLWLIVHPFQVARRGSTWVPVEAEVLNVRQERHSHGNPSSLRTVTAITYRYPAPGTGQEQLASANLGPGETAAEGEMLRVLVDPTDPGRSQRATGGPSAARAGGGCLRGGMLMLMGLLFVAASLLIWGVRDEGARCSRTDHPDRNPRHRGRHHLGLPARAAADAQLAHDHGHGHQAGA